MSKRTYAIWTSRNTKNKVTAYEVTDITDEEHKYENDNDTLVRPSVATFPVTQLYSADEQLHRAKIFKDYLNKINDAKQTAVEQTALIDILSAAAPTI